MFLCFYANRWPSLGGLLTHRWFSKKFCGSDGPSWNVQETSSLSAEHLVLGSWKAITLCPLWSSFLHTLARVMWSMLVNVVRDGMVNSPECAAM